MKALTPGTPGVVMLAMPFGAGKLWRVKTFTIRQVRGKASSVLDVCDREGRIRITRADGKSYLVERLRFPIMKVTRGRRDVRDKK